ncbi:hypothetical protein ACQKJC_08890 [Priestia koreensis]|uniref:hypothetical protein n=1 Tax=Priestia koreensis TaxID=284581 RepID=UPI003D021B9E
MLIKGNLDRKAIHTINQIDPSSWKSEQLVSILAGTGEGKSWFIKNKLYLYAKERNEKILFLVHRTNCDEQFQKEIEFENKTDVITIKTYQSIESKYKKHINFDFTPYQYIVADEFHYFMADSSFNHTTDLSLEAILSQEDKIRIFMSATGDDMIRYLNIHREKSMIVYEKPIDYRFIRSLRFFNKDSTMEEFIKQAIEEKQKAIFFIQSADKAHDLYEKYSKHCLFNCSKSNKHYKSVDKEKIKNMLVNERFEELILITTTCMDAGVNIHDSDLKNIVCDVKDIGTLIQCIGRKRLNKNDPKDGIYLHVKSISNQQLGKMISDFFEMRKHAKFLNKNGIAAYIEEYYRDEKVNNGIVYDEIVDGVPNKKVNNLMFFKYLINELTYDKMIKNFGNNAYRKQLAQIFNYSDYMYTVIEEDEKITDLNQYLESIVGVKLYKEEQKQLIDMICLKDKRGRIQKRIDTLNAYFVESKFNYIILPKKSGNTRYWKIESVDR